MVNKTYIFKNKEYSVDEMIPFILSENTHIILENTRVKVMGLRLESFIRKEPCITCGRQGTIFRIAAGKHSKKKDWHLTLWSNDGIQMTKDHIVPKSKGGRDSLNNIQTMCTKCNSKKGNQVSDEDFKKGEVVDDYNKDDYKNIQENNVESKAFGLTYNQLLSYHGGENFNGKKIRESIIGQMSTEISKNSKKYGVNIYLIDMHHPLFNELLTNGIIYKANMVYNFMKDVVISYRGTLSIHSTKMRMVPLKIRRALIKEYKNKITRNEDEN